MKIRLVILLATTMGVLSGYSAQKSGRLRVASNTVVVDVVATDKDNRHVMDLRKEELEVYEDDVLQEIDSFTPAHRPTTEQASVEGTASESAAGNSIHASKDALGNLMVFLLDYATVEYLQQDRVRKSAIRYVQERMHPSDVLAVFRVGSSFQLVQNFTSDKQKLESALEELDTAGSRFAWDQERLVQEASDAQSAVQTLISNLSTLRSTVPSPSIAMTIAMLERQQEAVERMETRAYAELSVSREMQARPVIAAIEAISAGLEPFPGRKTLILFSQGFAVPLSLERHLYNAVDRANKANVAIYAIDGAGLRNKEPSLEGELYDISALRPGDRARASMGISQFDRAREIGSDQPDSTLRYIAAATGGISIRHTNDLFGALQRIDNDLRSYYVLTYRPSNPNFDGAFRTIKVRANRSGVTLRFRQGYFAVPPGASLIMPDEYAALVHARSGSVETDHGSLHVQPYSFLDENGLCRILLSIEFPADLLESGEVKGGLILYPKLWGTLRDEYGDVVTSFRSPSKVSIAASSQQSTGERMVSLQNELSAAPGHYSIEVFLQAHEKRRSAYETRSVSLELPHENGLSLSSIVLSNRSTLNGRSKRFEHFPSATRRFRSGERVIFYLHAYNPDVGPDNEVELEVRAAVTDYTRSLIARLTPFAVTRLEPGGVPHAVVSRYVDLGKLSPGRYLLETEVVDRRSGRDATALTSFSVIK